MYYVIYNSQTSVPYDLFLYKASKELTFGKFCLWKMLKVLHALTEDASIL